jgi:hypothetical protein
MHIMHQHLLRNRHVINKHVWWVNTADADDIAYMVQLVADFPDFYEVRYNEPKPSEPFSGYTICNFYKHACDPDTVYVRLDDDIIWMASNAIEKIVACRVAHPEPFLIHGNVINNSICNFLHREHGAIPLDVGPLTYICECPFSWKEPANVRIFHELFFQHLNAGEMYRYTFDNHLLSGYERCSINVISWLGKDFAEFEGAVGRDEELWLSCEKPAAVRRPSMICGEALFSHFAFYTQRALIEEHSNTLALYAALAENKELPEMIWK